MTWADKLRAVFRGSDEVDQDKSDEYLEAAFDIDPMPRELSNEELQSIIATHYDVTQKQAGLLVKAIARGHEEGWGYYKTARHADNELGIDLPQEQIKTIVWNEEFGIRTRYHIRDAGQSDSVAGVQWMLPGDGDSSQVCQATAEAIDERGGSVSIEELQELLYHNAQKYSDGSPERVEHWIPHDRCRCTIQKAIGTR